MVISQRLWINGTECYCWESMVDHWEFPQLLPSTLAVRLQNQLLLFKKRARKIFLTEQIMRSQTPPMCDASGKLNFLLMFFWCRKTSIFYWFQLFRGFRDFSLSPLLNFIPLLPLTIFGVPLLLMNLHRARINDSVSRDSVTSMWIAWIVKQEKRHHTAVGQRNLCQR